MVGMKSDRLTVIDNGVGIHCIVKCECGTIKKTRRQHITTNKVKSCGCIQKEKAKEIASANRKQNGSKCGMLTIIGTIKIAGRMYYKCLCDCGKYKNIRGDAIQNGNSKSCGCQVIPKLIYGNKNRKRKKQKSRTITVNSIMRTYIRNANEMGRLFDLTEEQFKNIIFRNCFYCNSKPSNRAISMGKGRVRYNGVDRVDNAKGYVIENCVPCCRKCNNAKHHININIIKKAYLYLFGDKK